MRRGIGIWPPSNANRAPWWPGRAFWPFTPLPAVLPVPEPRPRPRRFLGLVEPALPWRLCSVIDMVPSGCAVQSGAETSWEQLRRSRPARSVSGLDANQVADLTDHAADRDGVLENDRVVGAAEPQAGEGTVLLVGAAD